MIIDLLLCLFLFGVVRWLLFWLPQCWGLPVKQSVFFSTFAPCLEHVCAGGGGGGGSVENEGLGLYIGGDYSFHLKC